MKGDRTLPPRASDDVRVYEAKAAVPGPIDSVGMALGEIRQSRHVLWHLFVRDFVAGFRQKLLGYLWVVLMPLMGIASFVFMQLTGLLNPGVSELPYPIFVFIGTTVWGMFVAAITTVANGLIANTDLIMRTNIPKIGIALTGLAQLLYNALVSLVVLVLLMALFGLMPSPWALLYPLAVVPAILLGVGVGLLLSIVGAVARDVTGMFIAVIGLVMYLTPVFHSAQFTNPVLQTIVRWNPLTYLVDTPRSLFVFGTVASPVGFAAASLFSVLVLWAGVHGFYLIKDKVTERL